MTTSQYFGQASCASNNSSTTISLEQLVDIYCYLKEQCRREVEEENKRSLETLKQELKKAIKIELSQMASQHSPPVEADIQLLATFVSTKGNCAKTTTNPSREEHATNVVPLMGLYVQCHHSTCLVTLGKFYDKASTIHNVDDVVKVSVEKVYNGDAQVHFLTSEIQYVRQTLDTFIACPRQS